MEKKETLNGIPIVNLEHGYFDDDERYDVPELGDLEIVNMEQGYFDDDPEAQSVEAKAEINYSLDPDYKPEWEKDREPINDVEAQQRMRMLNKREKELKSDLNYFTGSDPILKGIYGPEKYDSDRLNISANKLKAQKTHSELERIENEKQRLRNKFSPVPDHAKREIYKLANENKIDQSYDKYGKSRTIKALREIEEDEREEYYKNYAEKTDKLDSTDPERLSWIRYKYGKNDPINYDYVDKKKADSLWTEIKDSIDFEKSNTEKRKKIIAKKVSDYVKKNIDVEDPKYQESAEKELMEHMLDKFMVDNSGQLTIPGMKEYALFEKNKLEDYKKELQQNIAHATNVTSTGLPGQFGHRIDMNKGESESYRYFSNELSKVNTAIDEISKILAVPESREVSGMGHGIKNSSAKDIATLGVNEMVNTLSILNIVNKMNNGEEISFSEKQALTMYSTLNYALSKDTSNIGEKIGKGLVDMIPYIVTFAATGGAYTAARSGSSALGKKLIKKEVKNKFVKWTGTQVSRAIGAGAQTVVLPQYYVKNAAERMTDDVHFIYDEKADEALTLIDKNTGDDFFAGAWKGFADAYSEIVTERSGLHLMKALKVPSKLARKIKPVRAARLAYLNQYRKLKGFRGTSQMVNHVVQNKLGWHGIKEEYMEEFVNQFMAAGLTGDKVAESWDDFYEQQLVTFGTVAIFGGGMSSVKFATEKAIGDKYVIPFRDAREKLNFIEVYIKNW